MKWKEGVVLLLIVVCVAAKTTSTTPASPTTATATGTTTGAPIAVVTVAPTVAPATSSSSSTYGDDDSIDIGSPIPLDTVLQLYSTVVDPTTQFDFTQEKASTAATSFLNDELDVLVSSFPLPAGRHTASSCNQAFDVYELPLAMDGLSIIYNVPGVDSRTTPPLILLRSNLVDIYRGQITKWNDPKLVGLNLWLTGHTDTILPFYIQDSDLSSIFDKALSSFSNTWTPVGTSGSWPASTYPIANTNGQGYLLMQTTVSQKSSIGFIPYSQVQASMMNTTATIYNKAVKQVTASSASITSAVNDNLETLLAQMSNVSANNLPTYYPKDMWNVVDAPGTASWPLAYIVLLTFRLHSFPNQPKAQNVTKFLNWALGSTVAQEQWQNNYYTTLLPALVQPALSLLDKMTICEPVNSFNKISLVGGGSTVAEQATELIISVYSYSPSYECSMSYNSPNVISVSDAISEVKADTLDYLLSTSIPSDAGIHTFPFLGLSAAFIVNVPNISIAMLAPEDIQTIFSGGSLNAQKISVLNPNCTFVPIYYVHPDLATIAVNGLRNLSVDAIAADFTFIDSTEADTMSYVLSTYCSIGIISGAAAQSLTSPVSVVTLYIDSQPYLPTPTAVKASFNAGTLLQPLANTLNTYPLVGYLYISFEVTQKSNCQHKQGLASFIYWMAMDSSAIAAAGYYITSPFANQIGVVLNSITCGGQPLVTPITTVTGEGSVFAGPMYTAWATAYLASQPYVKIEYVQTAAGDAVDDLVSNFIMFAGTDTNPTKDQYTDGQDLGLYPMAAGALVIAYRLDDVNDDIQLTREVLVGIYLGTITSWTDDAITSLNPDVVFPNGSTPITLIYDTDTASTSSILDLALGSFSSDWATQNSDTITWPVAGVNADGMDDVASRVGATNYAIGCVGLVQALKNSLSYFNLQNKAGNYVTASTSTLQSAVNDFQDSFNAKLYCSLIDGPGANSWPIASYFYTVLHQTTMTDYDPALKLVNFILWSVNQTSTLININGYVPLPQEIIDTKFIDQLRKVEVNGQHLLSSPSKSKSKLALALGIGVGLGVGLMIIIALVIVFIIMYRRKGKKRIDPRTILSEFWDDLKDEMQALEAESVSSPSTPSGLTRLLKGKNSTKGGGAPVDLNNDVSIGKGKAIFMFGVPSGSRFPVDREVSENIELTNTSNMSIAYKIFVPHNPYQFNFQLTPGQGILKKGETVVLEAKFTLKMTTNLTRKVKFEFTSPSGQKTIHIAPFTMKGEVSTKLDPDDIDIVGKPIGKGAFGTVYKGSYRGSAVAIKVLRRQNDLRDDQLDEFLKEIELMSKLRSPHIVNLLGASYVPGKMCVLTEFMDKGSVSRLLKSGALTNNIRLKIAKDTARAMAFLHNNGVMHRDLKPANLLVVSLSKSAEITVKLSDFGTSRSVEHIFQNDRHTKGLGTPKYMAPELFAGQPYSGKVDVFAFAILLLELYIQKDPYNALKQAWDIPDFVVGGSRPDIPADVPGEIANIIRQCWAQAPEERPDFNQLTDILEPMSEIESQKVQASKKARPDGASPAELEGGDDSAGSGERNVSNSNSSGNKFYVDVNNSSNSNSRAVPMPTTPRSNNSNSNNNSNSLNKFSNNSNSAANMSSTSITNSHGASQSSIAPTPRNFRGEQRIDWNELNKQFEEGTDGADMTITQTRM